MMLTILRRLFRRFDRRPVDPTTCEHDWEVYSTALAQGYLEVMCRRCGLLGDVTDPSKEEWTRAYHAPSNPYSWTEPNRVRPGAHTIMQAMEISRQAQALRK